MHPLAGFFFGITLTIFAYNFLPTYHAQARDTLEQCENSIPKSVKCEITAVKRDD